MATPLDEHDGLAEHESWFKKAWTDGRVWELRRGKDFKSWPALCIIAHREAKRRGMTVRFEHPGYKVFRIQFVAGEQPSEAHHAADAVDGPN